MDDTELKQSKDCLDEKAVIQTSLTTSHGENSCVGMKAATSLTITRISQALAPMMLPRVKSVKEFIYVVRHCLTKPA